MKILVAAGSFKDVYTPIESCNMLETLLVGEHIVHGIPMCDGGENTLRVLREFFGKQARTEIADSILDPVGRAVKVPYLSVGDTAYLVSAEILHLSLEEDEYKNPLELTDYGLGQLLLHVIREGFRKIRLCLGGTSTIGFGLGTAQALGAVFTGTDGMPLPAPICLKDYEKISSICWGGEQYTDIELTLINDGITRACDLSTVNPLKIGRHFAAEKAEILQRVDELAEKVFEVTGLTANDAWSGNGGGIYFGVEPIFHPKYLKGADFFCDLFHLKDYLEQADLVITGEGRFDNPHLKKIPVVVAEQAMQTGKPCVLVCGQIGPEWETDGQGIHRIPMLKEQYGIDVILSCAEDYGDVPAGGYTAEQLRQLTPSILRKRLTALGVIKSE